MMVIAHESEVEWLPEWNNINPGILACALIWQGSSSARHFASLHTGTLTQDPSVEALL